jgi:hypothetical protein
MKKELPGSFSEQDIKRITDSLPEPVCERRRELLPQILHEWGQVDLQKHLFRLPLKTIHARRRKAKRVGQCAGALLRALKSADDDERRHIVYEMILQGRSPAQIEPAEWDELPRLKKQLDEASSFLTKLAAVAPIEVQSKPGHPRNYTAYLVLQDAAAIFLWFTGKEPTRQVDYRAGGIETGPFFSFACALWPIVFGRENGAQGLPAAMKNWAKAERNYDEVSPLLYNIGMRYPAWEVFKN